MASGEVSPMMVVHRPRVSSTGVVARGSGVPALSTGAAATSTTPRRVAHRGHAPLLIRTIRSFTWSKICRRSPMSEEIFSTACITVVWSRPPNSLAMAGTE